MQTRRAEMEKVKEKNGQKENDNGVNQERERFQNNDQLQNNVSGDKTTNSSAKQDPSASHATAEEIANNFFLSSMIDEKEKTHQNTPTEGQPSQTLTSNAEPSSGSALIESGTMSSSTLSSEMQEERMNSSYITAPQEIEPLTSTNDRKQTLFFPSATGGMTSESSIVQNGVQMNTLEDGVRLMAQDAEKLGPKIEHSMTTRSKELSSTNPSDQSIQSSTLPMSHDSGFDQSAHQNNTQNVYVQNGSTQQNLSAPYCQSAPPTMTSFEAALNTSGHPAGSLYHNYYGAAPPYSSTYGQSQSYGYPQQNQYGYGHTQSYDPPFQSHADQPGQLSHSNSSTMMHSQNGGLEPPPIFGSAATSVTSYDSEVGKGYHQQAHHYYHGSIPVPSDDLRRSVSSQRLGSNSYQPYTVPTQAHRATSHIGVSGQIGSSSIFMTNANTMPDMRLNPGAMHPGASYGRLPDGKIIELFPAMMRTVQACEYCRSRKAKCTGGLPCDRCAKKKIKCEYAQLDKKRKIKTTTSEYDMSSGAARMAANKTIEQAQAQLSAKIGMNTDRHDDSMVNHSSSTYSPAGRGASNRDIRMSKSTPGMDAKSRKSISRRVMSNDRMIRLAIDPISEEVEENICAQVMFSKPRFTAPIRLANYAQSTQKSIKKKGRQSPESDDQIEMDLAQQHSNVGPVIQFESEVDQELQDEKGRTTYSDFPDLNSFSAPVSGDEECFNINRSLYG